MILYIGILQCAPREWEKEIQTILPSFARNKYPPRCLRAINCGHERARVATRVDKYEEGTRGGTNRAEQREREREREREMVALVIISLSRNINITRAHPACEIPAHETRTPGAGSLPFPPPSRPRRGEYSKPRALTNYPLPPPTPNPHPRPRRCSSPRFCSPARTNRTAERGNGPVSRARDAASGSVNGESSGRADRWSEKTTGDVPTKPSSYGRNVTRMEGGPRSRRAAP
jgi:hypothetical protein